MKRTNISSFWSTLTDELILAGFRVWEALEESEIKHLCRTEDIDGIVLAYDVPWRKEIAARSGRVCVLLEPSDRQGFGLGADTVIPARTKRNSVSANLYCTGWRDRSTMPQHSLILTDDF